MDSIVEQIQELKKRRNAVILAHTYQPGSVQDIADYVGDSYGLSVQASKVEADTIIFCGVRFMAETAAILNPSRTVILPEGSAGCPMADMITAEELKVMMQQYPEYLVMCYVNSTADIKALSYVCVTSSNAVRITKKLPQDKGIIFVPDRHLGSYVQEQTGHTMVLWNGCCPTHIRITPAMIQSARADHPGAILLIHPEAPKECRDMSDKILSTGEMCEFVANDNHKEYIIATELGLIHTLQKQNPEKQYYPISEQIVCPNMKKTTLNSVVKALEGSGGEIIVVDKNTSDKAKVSLERMLEMARQ